MGTFTNRVLTPEMCSAGRAEETGACMAFSWQALPDIEKRYPPGGKFDIR